MKNSSHKFSFLLIFTMLFASAVFAQTERDKGIELYKQGKYSEAIEALKKAGKQKETKNDAEVWNILGLAYIKDNEIKEARKSFDKAVELDIQNSDYRSNLAYAYFLEGRSNVASDVAKRAVGLDSQNKFAYYTLALVNARKENYNEAAANLDTILSIDEKFSSAYLLKSKIYLMQIEGLSKNKTSADDLAFMKDETYKINRLNLLEKSADALEICVKVCNDSGLQKAEEELKYIKVFYDYFIHNKEDDQTDAKNLNSKKFVITKRSYAPYTDIARKNLINGKIALLVLLSENGKDKYILVVKGSGYGLDEQAVKAAQSIEFEPAIKDGKPISVVVMIQYEFSTY